MTMEEILQKLVRTHTDTDDKNIPLLVELTQCIRPRRAHHAEEARQSIRALCFLLGQNDTYRAALRHAIWTLLTGHKQVSLYTEAGIFPNNGFFSETLRRLSRSLFLPDIVDLDYLRDIVATLFHKVSDHIWVEEIGDTPWIDLLHALRFDELASADNQNGSPLPQLIEALRVLSYRITAIGLEPEMLRLDQSLEKFASPFMAQNVEMLTYLEQFELWWADPGNNKTDEKHLLVLLDQCHTVADRIRARAAREGTSLSLTLQLQRLKQNLARTEKLTRILSSLHDDRSGSSAIPIIVQLTSELIQAECRRNNLRNYMRQNIEVMALRVTENAGHTGEHYITESRKEYFALFRSALGAGFIVAFMAAIKIVASQQPWAPLNEAIAFCLNYGLGFVLIHMMHFTVATKQPAMTANALAASINESGGKARDLEKLTTLIARTLRSQTAAIIGNVLLAIPMAMLIGFATQTWFGSNFVTQDKAQHMLGEINLFSGAIFYAAIAGVCLFLSGQIAGYYDNLCAYNRIPERILLLKWPKLIFGEGRMHRFANYIRNNLGALAGNFFFGCMLGGTWAIGILFGLPIDIRHITFSAANIGFSAAAMDFHIAPQILWPAIAGTAMIGITNLLVSFTLALFVALRARNVSFAQRNGLIKSVLRRLWQHPREFLLPPRGAPKQVHAPELAITENKVTEETQGDTK